MADKQTADDAVAEPKSGRTKLIILLSVGVLLLIGTSVGVTVMLLSGGGGETAESQDPASSTPYYVELLDPKFAVNMAPESGARYLKLSLSALTFDPDVDSALRDHLPQLRSSLMLVLSSQKSQTLDNRAGRETLQNEVLKKVRQTLGQVGVKGKVESVYFTSFVMQ